MSREDKINEGQVLLDDTNKYRPLEKPVVETTAKKVNQLIKSFLQGNHISEMTGKWPFLMPNPPRIPVFLHAINDSQTDACRKAYNIGL